jgi:hypothetical protein
MECDDPGPLGPGGEERLKPELRSGAGVGEDQRRPAFLDGSDDFG